jgi:predicted metallopeptidase
MVDTCKHFEIGSGSVGSLSHLPVFVIEHLCRAEQHGNPFATFNVAVLIHSFVHIGCAFSTTILFLYS